MDDLKECREEFEVEVCKIVPRPLFSINEDGSYQEIMVRGFWNLWQAAWNRRAVPQANAEQDETRKLSLSIAVSIDYMQGWNDCIDATKTATAPQVSKESGHV